MEFTDQDIDDLYWAVHHDVRWYRGLRESLKLEWGDPLWAEIERGRLDRLCELEARLRDEYQSRKNIKRLYGK